MQARSSTRHALWPLGPLLALGLALLSACGSDLEPAPRAASTGGVLTVVDAQFPDAPDEVDMGHVVFGERVQRTLKLRNDSGAPLTIRNVRPGCSCTTPELSYTDPTTGALVRGNSRGKGDVITIPAGVVADMQLTIDSTLSPAKNQHKLIVVRVSTDSPDEPYFSFNVRVYVESFFLPSPALLDLRQVPIHGGAAGTLGLAADNPNGRILLSVQSSPLELLPELTRNDLQGAALWNLRVQLLPPLTLGFHEYEVVIATSGPNGEGEGPPVRVKVRATGVPDIALEPPLLMLDRLAPGERAPAQARLISRLEGQTLLVTSARIEGELAGLLQVEISPTQPDGQGRSAAWDLRLQALAELGDSTLSGRLIVETNEPDASRLETRIVYRP